jgi:membrane protease YdiL (CAAX protease family)
MATLHLHSPSRSAHPVSPDERDLEERAPALPQQSLGMSVLLHLLPGAALTGFVLLMAPVLSPALALFLGIGVVVAPMELGYLALYARRTTGSWSPLRAVAYRTKVPLGRLVALAGALATWFLVLLLPWNVFLDAWLADHLFGWMPSALTDLASTDSGGDTPTGLGLVALMLVLWLLNGLLGPVTEELYFRGHLLPRIERLGRWAPVINTALFSLYHFWSPWQILVRFAGFLPMTWTAWRRRSVYVSMAAHITINTIFLAFLMAALVGG